MGVLILGIGGYFFYQKKNLSLGVLTNFIPDNTLILLETNELSSPKNNIIAQIPLLSRANLQYQEFKKIDISQQEINRLIAKKTLYFAVLPEGKNSLAIVNYLPLNADNENFIEKLKELNQNNTGNRAIPHTTKGYKVLEVFNSKSKLVFAYIIHENFLIFSSSSLAVEEVILHKENSWIRSLKINARSSDSETSFTNTHLNNLSINQFLKDISSKKESNAQNLQSLLPESFHWLKPKPNSIECVSINNENISFAGQKAIPLSGLNMIPNSTSYMLNFSFDKAKDFFKQLEKFIEKDKRIATLREKASNKFNFSFQNLNEHVDGDLKLCNFDNSTQSLQNKILIIRQNGLLLPLNLIARNVAQNSQNGVFSVKYGSFLITSLGIKEFPSLLFGGVFGGFEETYFTEYNDYLVMSSSLPMMQEYLSILSKGDVWSNSPKHKTILKSCIPANITLVSETSKSLIGLKKLLNAKWLAQTNLHESTILGIQASIFQQNDIESRLIFLKNIETTKTAKRYENKWLKLGVIVIEAISEPMYLVNPRNKNVEILIQGSDKKLNLYNEGKRIWSFQIKGSVVGIKNSNVLDNPSQQLLVITNSNCYTLTRNEKGFEVKSGKAFKGIHLGNFVIFENESDRKQFFTLISDRGETFKLNKQSLLLQSVFKPNALETILSPLPRVIFRNIEYAVILSKSGNLFLQDANGKVINNFPLQLKTTFSSVPILERDDNDDFIRLVSDKGELFKISLAGKVIEKRQLYRPKSEVKFSLISDEGNMDWVLMRSDGKEIVVLDKNEHELFTIIDSIYGKKILNYYKLGIGGKVFSINNGYETYRFYDEHGVIIGGLPIESEFQPRLSYLDSYQKIIMNITTPTTVETWSVKVK